LAIFSPNCEEYAVVVLGTIAAAGVISPASVGFGADELVYQLKDCGAKALVTHSSVLDVALKAAQACGIPKSHVILISDDDSASALSEGVTSFGTITSAATPGPWERPRINIKEDLVALPYSSGTTGRPKGVRLSHYNLVSNVLSFWSSQNNGNIDAPGGNQRFISILPYSHIYGT
jgi:4-coumarate--CoA ligase